MLTFFFKNFLFLIVDFELIPHILLVFPLLQHCYNSLLLKAERPTMEVNRLRGLVIEASKTFKSLNSDFMHTYFEKGSHPTRRKNYLVANLVKTTTSGEKGPRTMGPKAWDSLPEDVKDLTSLPKFTEFIKIWYGPKCRCNICIYSGNLYHYTWI